MNAETIIGVVVQYGLPTFLLFGAAWYHLTQQKKWETERAEWAAERRELNKAVNDAVLSRVEDAREYGEVLTAARTAMIRSNEVVTTITTEWQKFREYDTQRELREMERDRDREIRQTGKHRPPALPREDR